MHGFPRIIGPRRDRPAIDRRDAEAIDDRWFVIGRAVLDPTTPFPVTSYAAGNAAFPDDPTTNQWFDSDLFDDYRLLGRHVADLALQLATRNGWFGDAP